MFWDCLAIRRSQVSSRKQAPEPTRLSMCSRDCWRWSLLELSLSGLGRGKSDIGNRFGRGKDMIRRFTRNLVLILTGILCISLFSVHSSAEDEFDAREGEGWNVTTDGVLTIEDNNGWKDYLKHGAYEDVNKLVIGKRLTKFYLFDDMYEEVEACFQFPDEILGHDEDGVPIYADAACCPVFKAKEIEVEKGNPVFIVEDGLLINQDNHTAVLADADQKAFVIHEGITTIGTWAFRHAEVETVQFPSTLQTIGIRSFCYCKNLTTLDFPDSLTSILAEAFADCENVSQIDLPNSMQVFGEGSFSGCGIIELNIPDGLQNLGAWSFVSCKSLKRVTLPSSLKNLGSSVFRNCTSLADILLPEGLETIGAEAFLGCENLKKISLPETLSEIGADAFQNLDFDLVEFPDTLKAGDSAFGRIHVAVFTGSSYEFSARSIDQVDIMLFLDNPPQGISKLNADSLLPKVYYTELFANAWKAGVTNGLNGWPTKCISLEEADDLIAQAVATPEPLKEPTTTTDVLGLFSNTPEPGIQPEAGAGTDPLVYVFAGLLALVVVGIVVVGVRARKKRHRKPLRKG